MSKKLVEKIGFNEKIDDDHITRLHRVKLIQLLCPLGHKECQSQMRDYLLNSSSSKEK